MAAAAFRIREASRRIIEDGVNTPNQNHNAFPNARLRPDGRVVMYYSKGVSHGAPEPQTLTMMRLSNTDDPTNDGWSDRALWLDRTVTTPIASHPATIPGVERWFYQTVDTTATKCWIYASDDYGETHYDPVDVGTLGFTIRVAFGGPYPMLLADGQYGFAVYGQSEASTYIVKYIKSSDGLNTATPSATIWDGLSGNPTQPEEPQQRLLADGRLCVMVRNDPIPWCGPTFSTNNGQTFTAPVQSHSYEDQEWPTFLEYTPGRFIVAGRDTTAPDFFGSYVRSSTDNLQTFSDRLLIDPDALAAVSVYKAFVPLPTGMILCVYALQTAPGSASLRTVELEPLDRLKYVGGKCL